MPSDPETVELLFRANPDESEFIYEIASGVPPVPTIRLR